jgi:hypothetical protein
MAEVIWLVEDPSISNAGIAIRTLPLLYKLKSLGVDTRLMSYSEVDSTLHFASEVSKAPLYIFSKPSKPEYISLMLSMKNQGCIIGLDIFDNYYISSTALDSFGVRSVWLNAKAVADFYFFSTPFLAKFSQPTQSLDQRSFLIGDPVPPIKADLIVQSSNSTHKWYGLDQSKDPFRVVWFGIDSNPFFEAGLVDIYKYTPRLCDIFRTIKECDQRKETPLLYICTKNVPAAAQLVSHLKNLGIKASFIEWSKEGCQTLLKSAHLVFLPTSSSEFILSKTHNRLTDAISNLAVAFVNPSSLYSPFVGGACLDSISALKTLLLARPSLPEMISVCDETLKRIAGYQDQWSDLEEAVEFIKSSCTSVQSSAPKVVIMGTLKDASCLKRLRHSRNIIAGVSSPLIKAPPQYDDITLMHTSSSISLRFRTDKLESRQKKRLQEHQTILFRSSSPWLQKSSLILEKQDSSAKPIVAFEMTSAIGIFHDLLSFEGLWNLDKSQTFREESSTKLILSMYELLHFFCATILPDMEISVVSSATCVGSFLDHLNERQ